jgi:hypothetical protein
MEKILELISPAAALAGAVSVLMALVAQFVKERLTRIHSVKILTFANEKSSEPVKIDYENETRLDDARDALRRQEFAARWSKWTLNLLTFGQYIVGGVLASSFVQSSLSKDVVGLLGVLVLVSSLIHQRFRPDLQYRSAKERAVFLRLLIRRAEDDVYAIQSRQTGAKTVQEIRQTISEGLAKLETSELSDANTPKLD